MHSMIAGRVQCSPLCGVACGVGVDAFVRVSENVCARVCVSALFSGCTVTQAPSAHPG